MNKKLRKRALNKTGWPVLIFAVLFLMVTGRVSTANANEGELIYRHYCAQCHGSSGDGKGINAIEELPTQPKDFTSEKNLPVFSDEQIVNTVKHGGPKEQLSFIMPPWGDILSDQQIDEVRAHLRKICKCTYDPEKAAAAAAEK